MYSSLKKRGGDRIWRSFFVNPNWSSAQPKSQSRVWLPGWSLTSKAVLCLHCWGWRGKQGRASAKVNNVRGGGFLFYLGKLPNPFLCKEAVVCVLCTTWAGTGCCDTMPGLLGNCLWGKNVYSPQLPNYAARWAEHVKWSTNQLCLFPSLLE